MRPWTGVSVFRRNKASSFDEYREMAKALTGGEGANKTYGFSAGPYMAAIGMFNKSLGGNNVFDERESYHE